MEMMKMAIIMMMIIYFHSFLSYFYFASQITMTRWIHEEIHLSFKPLICFVNIASIYSLCASDTGLPENTHKSKLHSSILLDQKLSQRNCRD